MLEQVAWPTSAKCSGLPLCDWPARSDVPRIASPRCAVEHAETPAAGWQRAPEARPSSCTGCDGQTHWA
eukprot:scaffold916_cov516-Prasinococcus_capsulatus_cf.AAC.23